MRLHITAALAGLLAGAIPGAYAVFHKPAPTIIQPQIVVVSKDQSRVGDQLTGSEQRRLAAMWGDLAQKEVDALSDLLKVTPRQPVTIFCADDALCGDLQLSLDNAFETAHWETKLEKPLIDNTVGVATSSTALRDAINTATSGRLNVGVIEKNAPYEALVIGKRRDSAAR